MAIATLTIVLRIVLAVLLWVFVLGALAFMRKDLKQTAVNTAPVSSEGNTPHLLTVTSGSNAGLSLSLAGLRDIVIGRHGECDFVINSDGVSRQHARMFHHEGDWFISDLASQNGTWVDGFAAQEQTSVKLSAGQILAFGPVEARLD